MRDRCKTRFLILALGLLAACGSSSEQRVETPPEPDSSPRTQAAEQRLAWAMGFLNGSEDSDEAALREAFSADFLTVVPLEQLQATHQVLSASAPYELVDSAVHDEGRLRATVRGSDASYLQLLLGVDESEPYRIGAFALRPADYLNPDLASSWEAVEEELATMASQVNLVAAEIEGDACRPLVSVNSDLPLGIGSAFKLYVLGALARGVDEGRLSWDGELAVNPDWRTLSSPNLRLEEDGAVWNLRQYAEAMISVSDNGATDHLIHHVGREQVEAEQAAMGHADPSLNTPFITTRDMFTLKLTFSQEDFDAYMAAAIDQRREVLEAAAETDMGLLLWGSVGWNAPRRLELEWFASASDLCRAMASLKGRFETEASGPVRDILSINPGTGFDAEVWSYIGFKGGSEPGVLNFTWLLQRVDGRWFVLTLSMNDAAQTIDTNGALRVAAAATNLLAATE